MQSNVVLASNARTNDDRGIWAFVTWWVHNNEKRRVGRAHPLTDGLFLRPETGIPHENYSAFVGWDALLLRRVAPDIQTFYLTGEGLRRTDGSDSISNVLKTSTTEEYSLSGCGTFDQ